MLHRDENVEIARLVCGPSGNNAYLVVCRRTNRAVIIDAPAGPDRLIEAAGAAEVEALLLTHGHGDHLAGLGQILSAFDAPVGMGRADGDWLIRAGVEPNVNVAGGARVPVGRLHLEAIHVPGHTPGSTAFLLPRAQGRPGFLFSGDALFPGAPGRTWSAEGFQEIIRSIRERLLTLPDETRVCPGHGDGTTIGDARREHGVFASRPHRTGLCGQVTWHDPA